MSILKEQQDLFTKSFSDTSQSLSTPSFCSLRHTLLLARFCLSLIYLCGRDGRDAQTHGNNTGTHNERSESVSRNAPFVAEAVGRLRSARERARTVSAGQAFTLLLTYTHPAHEFSILIHTYSVFIYTQNLFL